MIEHRVHAFEERMVKRLVPLLFIFLLGWGAQANEAPKTVRLCCDTVDVYPWVVDGSRGVNFMHLQTVAQRLGITFEITAVPWRRCLEQVRQGTMDGAFPASVTPERQALGVYPGGATPDLNRRLMTNGYALYRRKGDTVNYDGRQITGLSGPVGAQAGYSIVSQLREMGLPLDISSADPAQTLRKLAVGRIAAAALQISQGDESIRQAEFAGKIERFGPPLVEKPYYLLFGKPFYTRETALAEAIWSQIAVVRESAEFKRAAQAFR
jgi:polar amino acid transport system substrate-binding protein